ncbi:ABC transporter permease [Pseudoduganella sp. LjRoot289]|uniref:tetratricopeptide repeat protein n=1 Tax=Pseudoduganella sp. LjRoot289 TaxID=3342314 RepID=UPI003ECC2E2A
MTTLAKMASGALLAASLAVLGGLANTVSAANTSNEYCGDLKNAYGPYDYRKGKSEFAENLNLVEVGHFNSDVENGIKGITGTLGQELDYALRAFPNHARALDTLQRVALRDRVYILPGARRPVECYFNRAVRFAPDDPAVYSLYGNYLSGLGRGKEALNMFATAAALDPENPTLNYNLGLLHFKDKNYQLANKYAQIAYAAGFPLPGLKKMLTEAGKWDVSAAPPPKEAKPDPDSEPEGQPESKPAPESATPPEARKD